MFETDRYKGTVREMSIPDAVEVVVYRHTHMVDGRIESAQAQIEELTKLVGRLLEALSENKRDAAIVEFTLSDGDMVAGD